MRVVCVRVRSLFFFSYCCFIVVDGDDTEKRKASRPAVVSLVRVIESRVSLPSSGRRHTHYVRHSMLATVDGRRRRRRRRVNCAAAANGQTRGRTGCCCRERCAQGTGTGGDGCDGDVHHLHRRRRHRRRDVRRIRQRLRRARVPEKQSEVVLRRRTVSDVP